MDSIYKKVKNDTAQEFEKEALSQYYVITHLKETSYAEYKYKKQIYLIGLDYQNVLNDKEKLIERYKKFYCTEVENLYKGLLKNYSIRLAENISDAEKQEIYNKIFKALEEYISNVLPIKFEIEKNGSSPCHTFKRLAFCKARWRRAAPCRRDKANFATGFPCEKPVSLMPVTPLSQKSLQANLFENILDFLILIAPAPPPSNSSSFQNQTKHKTGQRALFFSCGGR